jgi:hypothetical protein
MGRCVDRCTDTAQCDFGEACSPEGVCVAGTDPCLNVACPGGQSCDRTTGRCVADNPPPGCRSDDDCIVGRQVCDIVTGECIDRTGNPCATVTCPEGQACEPATGNCVGGGTPGDPGDGDPLGGLDDLLGGGDPMCQGLLDCWAGCAEGDRACTQGCNATAVDEVCSICLSGIDFCAFLVGCQQGAPDYGECLAEFCALNVAQCFGDGAASPPGGGDGGGGDPGAGTDASLGQVCQSGADCGGANPACVRARNTGFCSRACGDHADCVDEAGHCVADAAGQTFCALDCIEPEECPQGLSCRTVAPGASLCLP